MDEAIFYILLAIIAVLMYALLIRAILSIPKILKLLTAQTKLIAIQARANGGNVDDIESALNEADIK